MSTETDEYIYPCIKCGRLYKTKNLMSMYCDECRVELDEQNFALAERAYRCLTSDYRKKFVREVIENNEMVEKKCI